MAGADRTPRDLAEQLDRIELIASEARDQARRTHGRVEAVETSIEDLDERVERTERLLWGDDQLGVVSLPRRLAAIDDRLQLMSTEFAAARQTARTLKFTTAALYGLATLVFGAIGALGLF